MKKEIFKEQFISLLQEALDDTEGGLMDEPESSGEAFQGTLDDGTDPSEYDTNPNTIRTLTKANVEEAKKWVQILNDFAHLINSLEDPDSLNNFLNKVDREGSSFRGIVRSQGKRVTRIAEEAAGMAQVLESHIIGSDKKERELLQQFPNLKA
jgi:hypothetical protein